jgi:hypothetical protein
MAGSLFTVEIVGSEGVSLTWTERLVERLGLVPLRIRGFYQAGSREAGPGEKTIARIEVEESESGPLFAIRPFHIGPSASDGAQKLEAASYDELADFLKGLLAEREGPDEP